jgi:hypothetical protein
MRKYILRNADGERVEVEASSLIEAMRISGAAPGRSVKPAKQCGGDCGDCNGCGGGK